MGRAVAVGPGDWLSRCILYNAFSVVSHDSALAGGGSTSL